MRVNIGLVFPLLDEYSTPAWATLFAGFFMLLSLCLSLYLVFEHLSTYNNPEEQKFLLGVILMVPCYAVESYVSLLNPDLSVDCGILRDGYEALAMYCFGRYLTACLGGEKKTIEFMEREGGGKDSSTPLLHDETHKGILHHHFPVNYILEPWVVGEEVYYTIKFGIFQYMVIKTLTATSSVILEAFGKYCDGEFNWGCGYPYMTIVLNFSQYWALYCLVQFYTATKEGLAHIQPLAKFLMFKSIVFLTWWQGVVIAIMYALGLLRSPLAQSLQYKSSIQDFIICIEMGIASVCHLYVFPAKPYEQTSNQVTGKYDILGDVVSSLPVDPDEAKDAMRPAKPRYPMPESSDKHATSIGKSMRDVVIGGGVYVKDDLKYSVKHARRQIGDGFKKLTKKQSKDDNYVNDVSPEKQISGIDDPLLGGSTSDSGLARPRKHRRAISTTIAEESWESGSQTPDRIVIHGRRWLTKNT